MHIELRKLKIIAALSEETACYTAEIWIDGVRAFTASNRGQGGVDDYAQVGPHSERDVNAWLLANRPRRAAYGLDLPHDLETEVAVLMEELEQTRTMKRQLRTQLVVIDDGQVYSYPLKGRQVALVGTRVTQQRPSAQIVNDAGAAVLARAVRLLLDNARQADVDAEYPVAPAG